MDNILIVAFDGLDHRLIQEYDCTTFTEMEEFGTIDNDTGVYSRVTPELFASFITGKTWKDHGVYSMKIWNKEWMNRVERFLMSHPVTDKTKEFRRTAISMIGFLPMQSIFPTADDLRVPTFFDEVDGAEAIAVPGYSKNTYIDRCLQAMRNGMGIEAAEWDREAEHEHRKKRLWELMEQPPALGMVHFHYPDITHHFHWPDREEKIEEMYQYIDGLAADIMEEAADAGVDHLLFMSDHGLPEGEGAHNKNAFYSSDTELFPDREPHITDFHDEILERVGGAEELGGVEV